MTAPVDLSKLEGAMLEAYQRELGLKLTDEQRLEDLYGSYFFEADASVKLHSLCATAAQLLEVEQAAINLVAGDKQYAIATYGADNLGFPQAADRGHPAMSLEFSYCQHIVGTERELSIEDTLRHSLVCYSRMTTEFGVRSYLGVPVLARSGHVLGSLCVWTYQPRTWSQTDVAMLTSLSAVLTRFEETG